MKASLVTGGAGFVGSHLCEALLQQGQKVICVDNLCTGQKENIQHLLGSKEFSLIEHDIVEPLSVGTGIDFLYNLASPASPRDFSKMPLEIILTNSIGTRNMLSLAREKNACFLQASSSEVYGEPLQHPQKESYRGNVSITGPRACYDESKRLSETLTVTFHRQFGLETRIARIFNSFGPRMRSNDGRVVPAFISQALANKPITVFGKGTQTRSFCFASDLVDGLIKLMNSNYPEPVNLGNPNEISVLQLAEKIKALCNSSSEIVFRPLPKDDPTKRQPDITLAKQVLNWQPLVPLHEGLKKTIEFFRKEEA